MTEHIRMRRFEDDEVRERQGTYTPEAKAFGPGAFSWETDGNGIRWLIFRYPDKVSRNSDGDSVGIGAVPVYRAGEERPPREYVNQREWDGNEEHPTLMGSVAIRTTEWEERFHGYVRVGWLDVL